MSTGGPHRTGTLRSRLTPFFGEIVARNGGVLYTAVMAPVKVQQSPLGSSRGPAAAGAEFIVAHVSDLHLASPDGAGVGEFVNKRMLGYLMWRLRRRAEHRDEVLQALLSDLRSARPDHVVITGDLTHLGLPKEFRKAGAWLRALGPPSSVTVIPGNHDVYVRTAWDHTFAQWLEYMVSDGVNPSGRGDMSLPALFPSLRIRGRIALIGVSTARHSAPLLAVGRVGQAQLLRLERVLEETGRQRLFRVVLIHHPPVAGTVSWHRRLTDSGEFRALLARQGAELVLHGHAHRTTIKQLRTPSGTTPAIGVPSASALGRRTGRGARYHLYHVRRDDQGWDVRIAVRAYSLREARFAEDEDHPATLPSP